MGKINSIDKADFAAAPGSIHLKVFVLKNKKERLLLQEEDGESHNTLSWIGWMMRQMDGKFHDVL